MTNQDIIKTAINELKSKDGYSFNSEVLIKTVNKGIVDGDIIYVGGGNYLIFKGDIVQGAIKNEGDFTILNEIQKSTLNQAQLDMAIKCKAKSLAQVGCGSAMGSLKS